MAVVVVLALVLSSCSLSEPTAPSRSAETLSAVYSLVRDRALFANRLDPPDMYSSPGALCYALHDTLHGSTYSFFIEPYERESYLNRFTPLHQSLTFPCAWVFLKIRSM
ncbi:hypothetical protein [Chitinivibrio alkaliphilus]|uniref:Uncharacterized protein n=1 Tax=Chitinivibrio alkaliphilus ACht1 TaxID=1313304 RepID=U7D473_9BACT|nr:hypothetical protein [Chitinivibrio alkaliphilus]ERP30763.1 hypothetical protein CALK_2405 [Chitinivibrio alkaliphilus ACht1]